jgi:hypothetical protein
MLAQSRIIHERLYAKGRRLLRLVFMNYPGNDATTELQQHSKV